MNKFWKQKEERLRYQNFVPSRTAANIIGFCSDSDIRCVFVIAFRPIRCVLCTRYNNIWRKLLSVYCELFILCIVVS